jgi:hypothetical protein
MKTRILTLPDAAAEAKLDAFLEVNPEIAARDSDDNDDAPLDPADEHAALMELLELSRQDFLEERTRPWEVVRAELHQKYGV